MLLLTLISNYAIGVGKKETEAKMKRGGEVKNDVQVKPGQTATCISEIAPFNSLSKKIF